MSDDKKPLVLSRSALIPAGLAVAAITLACGAAWWMSAVYSELKQVRTDTARMANRLDAHTEKVWETLTNHSERIVRLEARSDP